MNTDFSNILLKDYTYELPSDRIALYPLQERDQASLLVYNDGQIEKSVFSKLKDHLPANSLMVFNNTRVVQARLLFFKQSGAAIEIFCLEPAGPIKDIQMAFQEKSKSQWFCLVGNAKKWKQGALEMAFGDNMVLTVSKGEKHMDGFIIEFNWPGELCFAEVLELAGKTPLPPYIDRKAEEEDKKRYQTIFARHSGSVAAPTSGLHFTEEVMLSLKERNISTTYLTLHVGAGTFKPVSSPTIAEHQMHHEQIVVNRDTLLRLAQNGDGNIISVGTTSLRTLESLFWLGIKLMNGYEFGDEGFNVEQWEPYNNNFDKLGGADAAMQAILKYMDQNNLESLHGETSLIIVPGYKVRMANVLITNFHQPGSTLLLLVAAFCGSRWKNIYQFALENDFRFLSYGDSCLLFRDTDGT